MLKPVYFDYMSTTPLDPAVVSKMCEFLQDTQSFGNPASNTHCFGWQAMQYVQLARQQVAQLIHADANEIVFTSGATESNNLAIKGALDIYRRKGRHIVTMSTEHKAVLDVCCYLQSQGYSVTFLDPEPGGVLSLDKFADALREDTVLASIMHVNNETGVQQDIQALAQIAHQRGVLFHSDCAQSAGKIPLDVNALGVDLMSLSAHKLYGPKGVGALYVRRQPRVRLSQQMHGGGQESGMRSGTLPTHQIIGMGEAFRVAETQIASSMERLTQLRDQLWQGIQSVGGVNLHGDLAHMLPNCLNLSFDGTHADSLLLALRDLALSSGSACSSANPQPSHVLLAMGVSPEEANRSVRMSIGRFTTQEQVEFAVKLVKEKITRLRAFSAKGRHCNAR